METIQLNQKRWLVIYTRPRWEKKVDSTLKQQGIESYCPLKQVQNQWADRKKEVSLPLFTSYVFVRVSPREESLVLYCMGVMGYVYYMQRPAIVRDNVIEGLKKHLALYKDLEVISLQNISVGDCVLVKQGAFANQSGHVIQIQGKHVLMVFDNIQCALVTRVPKQQIVLNNLNQNNQNATR